MKLTDAQIKSTLAFYEKQTGTHSPSAYVAKALNELLVWRLLGRPILLFSSLEEIGTVIFRRQLGILRRKIEILDGGEG